MKIGTVKKKKKDFKCMFYFWAKCRCIVSYPNKHQEGKNYSVNAWLSLNHLFLKRLVYYFT